MFSTFRFNRVSTGTGYEHLQFFPKSVLPFKHLYNLATCYYHARVRLIFFVTRVQHPFPPKNYKLLGHPIVGSVRNIFLQFDVICDLLLNRRKAKWNL